MLKSKDLHPRNWRLVITYRNNVKTNEGPSTLKCKYYISINNCWCISTSAKFPLGLVNRKQRSDASYVMCVIQQIVSQGLSYEKPDYVKPYDPYKMTCVYSGGTISHNVMTCIHSACTIITTWCCCCLFGFYVAFNNFSVITRRCLVATGSSMLTFIVLPHWSIMPPTLDMIRHPVTLSWHWVDQS